jgi:UDP-2,4-diacetamido-2,4,6-trideoxy-beta-L-altropyranose hydrolase
MRCLTLADALLECGLACRFVCREHPGNLIGLIRQRGHEVQALPAQPASNSSFVDDGAPVHAAWLGASWDQDAEQTKLGIGATTVDWLIVDHYALDARWEQALRSSCRNLMAIDDLADRSHDCDVLLDQNLGRNAADYESLVSPKCVLLIGPSYALLKPEFSKLRAQSLARRRQPDLKNLLITMGGVDKDNITGKVLDGLRNCRLPPDCRITVVMGAQAPAHENVRHRATTMPWLTEVLLNVQDMAALMAESDLAIGAAGSTSWERCCLGLPSLIVVLAENQQPIAAALDTLGAVVSLGSGSHASFCDALETAINLLVDEPAHLSRMSARSQAVTEGAGVERVIEVMKGTFRSTTVRAMEKRDLETVLSWRNHPEVRKYMLSQHEISLAEHAAWFERASRDSSTVLLIVEEAGAEIGFVHFPGVQHDGASDWSFHKAPHAPRGSGRKLAAAALDYAFGVLKLGKVRGRVLAYNTASLRLHEKLGFSREDMLHGQAEVNGQQHELICFGLSRDEWLSHARPAA